MAKRPRYAEGGQRNGPGGGYYQEGVKLSRDPRLTPQGNYKERPTQFGDKINSVSGTGLSRPVSKNGPKTYGPA
jgi:hypothetical protein